MKKYEKPEMQVEVLVSDVLTASTGALTDGGTGVGDDVNFGDLLQ